MACSCRPQGKVQFKWTSEDGDKTTTYRTEIEAKAKVRRKGGSYEPIKG